MGDIADMQKPKCNVEEMKSLIFQAVFSLMGSKLFSDISVQQICDQAHISRPTFYRYFSNKYDIPVWHMERFFTIGTFQIGRTLNWETGLYVTTTGVAMAHEFYKGIDQTRFKDTFTRFGADAHKNNLTETITSYKHAKLTEKLEFQLESFTVAMSAMTARWVNSGLALPIKKEVGYMCSIVPRELFELLDVPSNPDNGATMHEIRTLFSIAKHELEMSVKLAEPDASGPDKG